MLKLLVIDSSARFERSLSRQLSADFISHWQDKRPNDQIIHRDVAKTPPPHVTEDWIAAAFTPEIDRTLPQKESLNFSNVLVAELLEADVVIVSAAMYNYGMPSTLKAWLDQTVRVGKTFSFDLARGDHPIEPIQTGKSLVMLTSSGEAGFGISGKNADANHLDKHMFHASRLLGVSYHHTISIEYQEFNDDRHQHSIRTAKAAIPSLAQQVLKEHNCG